MLSPFLTNAFGLIVIVLLICGAIYSAYRAHHDAMEHPLMHYVLSLLLLGGVLAIWTQMHFNLRSGVIGVGLLALGILKSWADTGRRRTRY